MTVFIEYDDFFEVYTIGQPGLGIQEKRDSREEAIRADRRLARVGQRITIKEPRIKTTKNLTTSSTPFGQS